MNAGNRQTAESFWARVDRTADGCWPFPGYAGKNGYATVLWHGKKEYAHRKAWELTYGLPPSGRCVCHRCDNRICVNPAHLFIGVDLDNKNDMVAKKRQAKHKLTEESVRAIRIELASGDSVKDVAGRYSVSTTTISLIKNRRAWKWLDSPITPQIPSDIVMGSEYFSIPPPTKIDIVVSPGSSGWLSVVVVETRNGTGTSHARVSTERHHSAHPDRTVLHSQVLETISLDIAAWLSPSP